MFGAGVPYSELKIACSIWERQDRNLSQQITAGNAEPVPVSVRYENRYDAVEDLPLWDTGERWSIRFENTVGANDIWNCASGGGLTRPVSGSVARTDLYRRCTVSAEYTVDHCGLQFVPPEPGEQLTVSGGHGCHRPPDRRAVCHPAHLRRMAACSATTVAERAQLCPLRCIHPYTV